MSEPTTITAMPPEDEPPRDPSATLCHESEVVALPTFASGQFELGPEIARGGMGVVHRAVDSAFGREVAVKLLLDRYDANSAAAARFFDEARITGQLQHPAIPPVHVLGALADGRPFLAMKLIEGRTLAEHLEKRRDPSENLGRWSTAFEQVCQGVGYAHSRRIIHRDLKPSNIMVGEFGEVQVMDWGLAKSLGEGVEREPLLESGPSAESTGFRERTQAGSMMGTLAFMPPEQAAGDVDQVDERADVFGLGAILCVILTGRPPYADSDFELLLRAATGARLDDAFARLDSCGADPAWSALAKRCLAKDPAARFRNGGEVAEAVAALRADSEMRAREAEMERARAEVIAGEERKRRRVQRALAAAVVLIVAGAGVAAWQVDRMQSAREAAEKDRASELLARQLTTERDVAAALNEVQLLREQGLKQSDDPDRWSLTLLSARSALKRAETALASGEPTDELRARVASASGDLNLDELDQVLLSELDRTADGNEIRSFMPTNLTSVVSKRFADAFRRRGIDLKAAPISDAIAWLKSQRFRTRLALAIRGWTHSVSIIEQYPVNIYSGGMHLALTGLVGESGLAAYRAPTGLDVRLRTILEQVDGPFEKEWWAAVKAGDSAKLKVLIQRPEFRAKSSRELATLTDGLIIGQTFAVYREVLNLAYERFPGEFWVHIRMAMLGDRGAANGKAELMSHLTGAIAARPKSAIARTMMGMELLDRKQEAAGRRMLKSASEIDPTSPWPHVLAGMDAAQHKNWDAVQEAYSAAARADPDITFLMVKTATVGAPNDVRDRVWHHVAAARPDHPGSHELLGVLHQSHGDDRAALGEYRRANAAAGDDYAGKSMIMLTLGILERRALWEAKLDDVLAGTIRPRNYIEWRELAHYAAGFERRYALAVRFGTTALELNPQTLSDYTEMFAYAGWAVQASVGAGTDASRLLPEEQRALRARALEWLTECRTKINPSLARMVGATLAKHQHLAPVREPEELAKLPVHERAEWERFWNAVEGKLPQAPPPRMK